MVIIIRSLHIPSIPLLVGGGPTQCIGYRDRDSKVSGSRFVGDLAEEGEFQLGQRVLSGLLQATSWVSVLMASIGSLPEYGGPQYRPQPTLVLIMGTPEGNPQFRELLIPVIPHMIPVSISFSIVSFDFFTMVLYP